ncbi:MAG: hypothetical protein ACOCUR_02950, partial [Nanoarchaeota archaeon]
MDDNVKTMKKLLEKGYKIISHNIKFSRDESGTEVMIDTIKLKTDNDEQTISSTNSKEFFDYIKHFVRMIDKYENIEFVYIDDLEQYNKNISKDRNHPILQDVHTL